jgi:hypothetical protein
MLYARISLTDVAERIASTEHRHSKLRVRIKRLKDEGSDASQEEEVLGLLSHNLAQLYVRQVSLRRTSWTIGTAALTSSAASSPRP